MEQENSIATIFKKYIQFFEQVPEAKEHLAVEFRAVVYHYLEELSEADDMATIFCCLQSAVNAFPNNVYFLNKAGLYLAEYGYHAEAMHQFRKGLKIEPYFAVAEKNIKSVKELMFPRVNFRILNDLIANEAYRSAIRRTVIANVDTVLDIDAGIGLHSLYASECAPLVVTACEFSPTLANLTTHAAYNHAHQTVRILNKASTSVTSGDIRMRHSILLTDMFDSGLFGIYALQRIAFAWENLLTPNAKVVPSKAEFFVVGAKSATLNKKYKLCSEIKNALNISEWNVHSSMYNGEGYLSEDVHLTGDVEYVTDAESVLEIDFNNYQDIQDKLYNENPYEVALKATKTEEMNVIIGYFNLYLAEGTVLTTDPRASNKCKAWEQAVFMETNTKRNVTENEATKLQFLCSGGRLRMPCDPVAEIIRISPQTLKFLNDVKLLEALEVSVDNTCARLLETTDLSEIEVLDLSPFPYFGLQMLRRGAKRLTCHMQSTAEREFLEKLMEKNDINDKLLTIIPDPYAPDAFTDNIFDVIFCNVIDLHGDIEANKKALIDNLRVNHLRIQGVLLPKTISVYGQVIQSQYLVDNNFLNNNNIHNYKLSTLVNKYSATYNTSLEVHKLQAVGLSDAFLLTKCWFDIGPEFKLININQSGVMHGILCWYEIDVGGCRVTTLRNDSFAHNMAFITRPEALVERQYINLHQYIEPEEGTFFIKVQVPDNER